MSKKGFTSGVLTGIVGTLGLIAGAVAFVKKTVIDPIDEKERKVEENRKKSQRKHTRS